MAVSVDVSSLLLLIVGEKECDLSNGNVDDDEDNVSEDKLGPLPSLLHLSPPSLAINLGEGVNGDEESSMSDALLSLSCKLLLVIIGDDGRGGRSLFLVLIIVLGENRMPLPSLSSSFCN